MVLAVPLVVATMTLVWYLFVRHVPTRAVEGWRVFQPSMRARSAGELGWTLLGNFLRTMDIIYCRRWRCPAALGRGRTR